MSKLSNQLRELKIYNNHGLLTKFGGPDDVAIEYHRPADGRLGWTDTAHTSVWSIRENAKLGKPRRSIHSGGEKQFLGLRRETYQLAINWAMETFGHDYSPSPFGGHIPRHILAKAQSLAKGLLT